MNALLILIPVMVMHCVLTLLGTSLALVSLDTVEMAPVAKVSGITGKKINFLWPSYSLHTVNLASTPSKFSNASIGTTFIFMTWSQAPGEVVDTYEILYSFTINGCPGIGGQDIMHSVNGSLRQYNLTGLQEDSVHDIQIRARNGAGDSASAQLIIDTHTAGNYVCIAIFVTKKLCSSWLFGSIFSYSKIKNAFFPQCRPHCFTYRSTCH